MGNNYSSRTGVEALRFDNGYTFTITNITYSFDSFIWDFVTPMSEGAQAAAVTIFQHIEDLTNLTFTNVTNTSDSSSANIKLGSSVLNDGVAGVAYLSNSNTPSILIDTDYKDSNFSEAGFPYHILLHEIGHALGLAHTHEEVVLPLDEDSTNASVMSYNSSRSDYVGGNTANRGGETSPMTYQLYDIAELQYQYGINNDYNSGDNVYSFNGDNINVYTLWDGGGIDTIDASEYTGDSTITLKEGLEHVTKIGDIARTNSLGQKLYPSGVRIWNAYGSNIENAIGGVGNDSLYGNQLDNVLDGGSGDDYIDGHNGSDTIYGGDGSDRLYGKAGVDSIYGGADDDWIYGGESADIIDGGSGARDIVIYTDSSVGITVDLRDKSGSSNKGGTAEGDKITNVERIFGSKHDDLLIGSITKDYLYGHYGNDSLYGNNGDDYLDGRNGDDLIYGGHGWDIIYGKEGADKLYGNSGNDKLYGGYGNDVLDGGDGSDSLYGSAGEDQLSDSVGNDYLIAGSGNDVLKATDTGNDYLYGGTGNDTFLFNDDSKGHKAIMDFIQGDDKIQIFNTVEQFSDLIIYDNTDDNAVIWFTDLTITLDGIQKHYLQDTWFEFVELILFPSS